MAMSYIRIIVTFVAGLFVSFSASAADWEGVFEGTLGTAPIIVELNAGAEKSSFKGGYADGPRYSYLPKTRDISLILDKEGESLAFTETLWSHHRFADEADKHITGTWQLQVKGDKATGTWTSPKGETSFPIRLTRAPLVPAQEITSDQSQLAATYDLLWLNSVSFTDAGTANTFGPVEIRWSKDSAFNVAYPVIGNFPDGKQKAVINTMLLLKHMKSVLEYRNCLNGVAFNWSDAETEPSFNFEITYASPTVLSYTVSGSVFCGGAHNNNFTNPQSFDLTAVAQIGGGDQQDLSPQGFGRILKLETREQRIAFERFALGRWKAEAARDIETAADCTAGWIDDAAEGEKDFDLLITEKGIGILRTDYPHVASACMFQSYNPTIIPWSDIKPFVRLDQNLLTKEIAP